MSQVEVLAALRGSAGGAREPEAPGTTVGEVRLLNAMAGAG